MPDPRARRSSRDSRATSAGAERITGLSRPSRQRLARREATMTDGTRVLGRREFVERLGGGIVVLVSLPGATMFDELLAEAQQRGYPADINAYLHIAEDGRVTFFSGKIEMGQGIVTSLPQMAAEELR